MPAKKKRPRTGGLFNRAELQAKRRIAVKAGFAVLFGNLVTSAVMRSKTRARFDSGSDKARMSRLILAEPRGTFVVLLCLA
jgi:hypothetical protein